MKGILFTPENIKAIRDNRKTVTRRKIKQLDDKWEYWPDYEAEQAGCSFTFNDTKSNKTAFFSPRYQVGEVVDR